MGRKQFRLDLSEISSKVFTQLSNIEQSDDGEISFQYQYTSNDIERHVELKLLALNVDEYPEGNEYMLFTNDNDVEAPLLNSFDMLSPLISGRSVPEALQEVSTVFNQVVSNLNVHVSDPMDTLYTSVHDATDDDFDGYEEVDWSDDDDETFGFSQPKRNGSVRLGVRKTAFPQSSDLRKIKSDLRATKVAGFRVGLFGDLATAGIVCVSVRIAKLGISEEVMKAWNIEPRQYFAMLLRFQNGYRNAEQIREIGNLQGHTEIRVGLCSRYKPSTEGAFDAFNQVKPNELTGSQRAQNLASDKLQPLFISHPLNTLLRERFSTILKLREIYSLAWCGAELLFNDSQGRGIGDVDFERYDVEDNDPKQLLPAIVKADSMFGNLLKDCSIPLLAMQFSLRHFVRCTEFCLVCHCRVEEGLEALKPYVCSKPLCLFQYMALGFGPSIEWEILSQPYVVDLLISFCYAQAANGRLRDFPTGINIRVPFLPQFRTAFVASHNRNPYSSALPQPPTNVVTDCFRVQYSVGTRELLFDSGNETRGRSLQKGSYIALLNNDSSGDIFYHRIEEAMFPVMKLSLAIIAKTPGSPLSQSNSTADKWTSVICYPFTHDFDELHDDHKQRAILALLDTLPPVQEMRKWLQQPGCPQDNSLRNWRERMMTPALDVLRWIIASNRSCIMQVDAVVQGDQAMGLQPSEGRVSGMDEYMQFRFAQGAPDKEQRFVKAIQGHSLAKPHPTIFAWHGSPLQNWHSIIREGLHFNETLHGRAYGNGVYMSNYATTSQGYSSMNSSPDAGHIWPNSELKVARAFSLNEVVNEPESFVSKQPHYVVAQTDWIQTRYLFVKTAVIHSKETTQTRNIIQDPKYAAVGSNGAAVQIPITAVPKSRNILNESIPIVKDSKKRKNVKLENANQFVLIEDDVESLVSTEDDLRYILEDAMDNDVCLLDREEEVDTDQTMSDCVFEEDDFPRKKQKQSPMGENLQVVKGCLIDPEKTSFLPGHLDMSNIRRLPPPEDASRAATNALMKAFKTLVVTQKTTPAHELGWYIDPELENMYQWIVELHSFGKDVPLASDMKAAGIDSVVIEMRFTNQYPFAPPFVRVIQPRFVPFNQGGGGHVTEGGAICMELLTNNGWSAVSSIESVLLQIQLAMSEKERPARLPVGGRHGVGHRSTGTTRGTYGVGEAMTAYERACRAHGWKVPEAFSSLLRQDEK